MISIVAEPPSLVFARPNDEIKRNAGIVRRDKEVNGWEMIESSSCRLAGGLA